MKSLFHQAESIRFSLQEAFIALLPFVVLMSAIRLVDFGLIYSGIQIPFLTLDTLAAIARMLDTAVPVMLAISVSFHLSILFGIDRVTGAGLALAVFLFDTYGTAPVDDAAAASLASVNAVVAPLLSLLILHLANRIPLPRVTYGALSYNLANALNMLVPAVLAFLSALVLMKVLHMAGDAAYALCAPLFLDLGQQASLALFLIGSQLIWFFGLHGTNLAYLAVDPSFGTLGVANGMTRDMFMTSFVNLGGSGGTMCLALAVLIFARNQHMRTIALIALPFTVFNISEVLVFGLPLVFNLRLLLPFVLVPVVFQVVATTVISHIGFVAFAEEVPWIAPIFLNVFLQTGQAWTVLLQAGLVIIGTAIYAPFVIRYAESRGTVSDSSFLSEGADFDDRIRHQHGRAVQDVQSMLLRNSEATRQAVDFVRENQLAVHYQPKIDGHTGRCIGFEALLRVWVQDNHYVGPYFLETLENAGFAQLIDRWVCRQVLQDLPSIQAANPGVILGVNLHPDTIADRNTVNWLIETFAGTPVCFEIIERGLRSAPEIPVNIGRLAASGLSIAIDDFGAGYSNLNLLAGLPVDTIKFDRTLLLNASEDRGRIVYGRLTSLCHDLGYRVMAEGVETRAQLRMVRDCGVDVIQGWYFAKAMPLEEAIAYASRPRQDDIGLEDRDVSARSAS
uniref:EAL domain-containing protein n=1 Tax=Stappia sp. TaxID=1870903 RepID=UPI003BAC3685